jgi:hypothetical protein
MSYGLCVKAHLQASRHRLRLKRATLNNLVNRRKSFQEEEKMLWTIVVILLLLWALGLVSSYSLGGFIHILLLVAIAVIVIRLVQGRRPMG